MKLKRKVASLEGIPEQLQGFYQKQGDGSYLLSFAVDGEEEVSGLKSAYQKTQDELKALKEKFGGVDLEKYQQLTEQERKIAEKKLIDAGQIDELLNQRVSAMKSDYEKKIAGLTDTHGKLQSKLASLMIDGEVKSAAVKLGVRAGALPDVIARARGVFSVDGERVIAKEGDRILMGKDGTNPLGIEEYLANLAKDAGHLFEASNGSGAQGSGHSFNNQGQRVVPNNPVAFGQNLEAIAKGQATISNG